MSPSHDSATHTTEIASAPADTVKPQETAAATPQPETAPAPAKMEEKPVEKQVEKPIKESNYIKAANPKVVKEAVKPSAEGNAAPQGKQLNPRPNGELSESEVNDLNQFGIKNMFLSELTAMIMQKFPGVGNVYQHQQVGYALLLMQANKGCFKKTGAGYVCITDALHHIPVHK